MGEEVEPGCAGNEGLLKNIYIMGPGWHCSVD